MTQIAANSYTRLAHANPARRTQPGYHTRQGRRAWALGLLCALMLPWATPALARTSPSAWPTMLPGVDFIDPFLNAIGFDANQPLELLLEGYLDLGNGEAQWAYSEVYPLGYNWPEAADRLFDGDFEALVGRPEGTSPRRIVRPRLISSTSAFR